MKPRNLYDADSVEVYFCGERIEARDVEFSPPLGSVLHLVPTRIPPEIYLSMVLEPRRAITADELRARILARMRSGDWYARVPLP